MSDDRKDKLLAVLKEINKSSEGIKIQFGSEIESRSFLSTGIETIDRAFGGGFSKGSFSVIYGGEGTGKSTLAYHTVAKTQKENKTVCYIDLERSFDPERAKNFNVDLDKLVLLQEVETAEKAMDCVIKLTRESVIDLIVIDSIQAMSASGEQFEKSGKERSMDSDEMAILARKLSKFFRVCANSVSKSKCAVLLIGQVRKGLGSFVVTDTLSGGCALGHWAVFTAYIRKGQHSDAPKQEIKHYFVDENGKVRFKTEKEDVGHDTVIKVKKTKITGSLKEGQEIHISFYAETGFVIPDKKEVKVVYDGNSEEVEQIKKHLGIVENEEKVVSDLTPEEPKNETVEVELKKRGRKPKVDKKQ